MNDRVVARESGSGGIPVSRRRWWLPLVKLLLTVAVTWFILSGAGIRLAEAWTVDWTLVRPTAPFLALSVGLLFLSFAVGGALWARILWVFGEARVATAEGAAILLVANLGRYVPGKIAQLVGLAMLSHRRGLSGVRATAAGATGQMINLLAAAAVGGWVAVRATDFDVAESLVPGLAVVAGLAAFLYFGGAGIVLRWVLRRSGHVGDLPLKTGRRLLFLLPGYVLNWLILGGAFVCLGRGLGLELGVWSGTSAFAAAYFAGYIIVVAPAGIGVREGALVTLLAPTLGAEAAIVLAALQRVWITVVEVAGAAAAVFVLRRPGATGGSAHPRRDAGERTSGNTTLGRGAVQGRSSPETSVPPVERQLREGLPDLPVEADARCPSDRRRSGAT